MNERVFANLPVRIFETPIDEARKLGAMMLFGEKYGDVVRVVDIDGWSVELCGGTHVRSTAEIGPFAILSEGSVGSGARRIEAVTAGEAFAYLHEQAREADALRASSSRRARRRRSRSGGGRPTSTIVDKEGQRRRSSRRRRSRAGRCATSPTGCASRRRPTARSSARSTTAARSSSSTSTSRSSRAGSTRRSSCASSASTSAAAEAASRRSPRPAARTRTASATRSRRASRPSRRRSHEGDGARLRLGAHRSRGLRPDRGDRAAALRRRARGVRGRPRRARSRSSRTRAPSRSSSGMPLTLRGERGEQARETEQFAASLRARLDVPVVLVRRALHDRPRAADAVGHLRGRARGRASPLELPRVVERRPGVMPPKPGPPPRQVSRGRVRARRLAASVRSCVAGLVVFGDREGRRARRRRRRRRRPLRSSSRSRSASSFRRASRARRWRSACRWWRRSREHKSHKPRAPLASGISPLRRGRNRSPASARRSARSRASSFRRRTTS